MLENVQMDSLTGFMSRENLTPFLERLAIEASLKNKVFSIALIDLDRFKKFNDRFGHIFGDEILKYASSTLRLTFNETLCYIFRFGGDEFIAVLPDIEPKNAYQLLKQCSRNFFYRPFLFKNKFYKISFSCGIAGFPGDGTDIKDLINKADKSMYCAKRLGRNQTVLSGQLKPISPLRLTFLLIGIGLIVLLIFILYQKYTVFIRD